MDNIVATRNQMKCIAFGHFMAGYKHTESYKLLKRIKCKETRPSDKCFRNWFREFNSDDISLKERKGAKATVTQNPECHKKFLEMIEKDPHTTMAKILKETGIYAQRIPKELGYRYTKRRGWHKPTPEEIIQEKRMKIKSKNKKQHVLTIDLPNVNEGITLSTSGQQTTTTHTTVEIVNEEKIVLKKYNKKFPNILDNTPHPVLIDYEPSFNRLSVVNTYQRASQGVLKECCQE